MSGEFYLLFQVSKASSLSLCVPVCLCVGLGKYSSRDRGQGLRWSIRWSLIGWLLGFGGQFESFSALLSDHGFYAELFGGLLAGLYPGQSATLFGVLVR